MNFVTIAKALLSTVLAAGVYFTCHADELLQNSFLSGTPGKIAQYWNWRIRGNADHSAAVEPAGIGMVFSNRTGKVLHTYSILSQNVQLLPGKRYKLTICFWGKGKPLRLVVGRKWACRFLTRTARAEMTRQSFEFTAPGGENLVKGKTPVMVILENPAEEIHIDRISLKPVEEIVIPPEQFVAKRVWRMKRLASGSSVPHSIPAGLPVIRFPGDGKIANGKLPSPQDFSAECSIAFDDNGFWIFGNVRDNECSVADGPAIFNGDSIQIRLNKEAKLANDSLPSDLEIGFAVDRTGKAFSYCFDGAPYAGRSLPPEICRLQGRRTKNGYFFAACISWKIWGAKAVFPQKFTFTLVCNDVDRDGRRHIYYLTPGIHDGKRSADFCLALPEQKSPSAWIDLQEDPDLAHTLAGKLIVSGKTSGVISAVITGRDKKPKTIQLYDMNRVPEEGILKLPVELPLAPLTPAPRYRVEFRVGSQSLGSWIITNSVWKAELLLKSYLERLEKLNKGLAVQKKIPLYIRTQLFIFNELLPQLNRRFSEALPAGKLWYARETLRAAPGIADALSELEKMQKSYAAGEIFPVAWNLPTGDVKIVDGWPFAEAVDENGKKQFRPVICAGFGHFETIDRNIAKLQYMGCNTVHIDTGPTRVFPFPGKTEEFEAVWPEWDRRFVNTLKGACENNVKIGLMLSPHFVKWIIDKYPEMAYTEKHSFLPFDPTHPKAEEMMRKYITVVLSRFRGNPHYKAIHSLMLVNEPTYPAFSSANPVSVAHFQRYMKEKYGSVAEFNRRAQRNYADFKSVMDAARKDSAAGYEFYSCSRKVLADWLERMGKLARSVWPGLPIHTKVMIFRSPFQREDGIDFERIGSFSDYNGNDNYFMPGKGKYLSSWEMEMMTNELQISLNHKSVANMEGHLFPDRTQAAIQNDHIYTATFERFISGVSTLTSWVYHDAPWEATRKPNSHRAWYEGLYHRPGNLVAHTRAIVDGMRLAPEIRCFFSYRPEAALLYADSTVLTGKGMLHRNALRNFYAKSCFTGYRLGFCSERQLERRDWGKIKVLFVTGTPNVSKACRDGLKAFVASGGKIYVDSVSLTGDEYGNTLAPDFPAELLPAHLTLPAIAKLLVDHLPQLPIKVSPADGIFYRMVPGESENDWLVNLVNYNHKPCKLHLNGDGKLIDLMKEKQISDTLELIPLKPVLLKFTPAE